MNKPTVERIAKVAILIDGEIYSVEPPGRHHDVIKLFVGDRTVFRRLPPLSLQGFVTTAGRFVDRKVGKTIAVAAKQIIRRCGGDENALFSENLW